jgi:hypothetical protein
MKFWKNVEKLKSQIREEGLSSIVQNNPWPAQVYLWVILERGGTCVQAGHRLTTEGLCSVVIGEIGYRARWRTLRAILVIGGISYRAKMGERKSRDNAYRLKMEERKACDE